MFQTDSSKVASLEIRKFYFGAYGVCKPWNAFANSLPNHPSCLSQQIIQLIQVSVLVH